MSTTSAPTIGQVALDYIRMVNRRSRLLYVSEMTFVRGLSAQALAGINFALKCHNQPPLGEHPCGRSGAEFPDWLKTLDDLPEWFPKGKWATIQKVQELCGETK